MAQETKKLIIIQKLVYYFINILLWPLKTDRQISAVLSGVMKAIGRKVRGFVFYTQRPLNSDGINYTPVDKKIIVDLSIIMQGPLKKDDDFTLETVKIYKQLFPGALIIVSTWKTEDSQIINRIEQEGALVILNDLPEINGVGNINYQKVSTLAGLCKAKELGCSYSMKTRTDQRVYKTDMYPYLRSLLQTFQIDDVWHIGQKERIAFCQGIFPNSMLIPFHVCDFFFFGSTNDLISYFDCEFSQVDGNFGEYCEKVKKEQLTIGEYFCKIAPEAIFSTSYLKRHGIIVHYNNLEDYWKFVVSYLVPVSFDDLNLVWYKYAKLYNESNTKNDYRSSFKGNAYNQNWSFANWLSVKTGQIKPTKETCDYCKHLYID